MLPQRSAKSWYVQKLSVQTCCKSNTVAGQNYNCRQHDQGKAASRSIARSAWPTLLSNVASCLAHCLCCEVARFCCASSDRAMAERKSANGASSLVEPATVRYTFATLIISHTRLLSALHHELPVQASCTQIAVEVTCCFIDVTFIYCHMLWYSVLAIQPSVQCTIVMLDLSCTYCIRAR